MPVTIVVLGLVAALAYGTSDFLGGLASRRGGSSLAVVALFKLVVLVVFAAAIPLSGAVPSMAGIGWGGLAGVAIGSGYIVYFRGLRVGRMGIVASLAAVWSAIVPVVLGVAAGERPTPLAWAGIAIIILSLPVFTYSRDASVDSRGWISRNVTEKRSSRRDAWGARKVIEWGVNRLRGAGVLEGTLSGIGFGLFFSALGRASDFDGQAWPLLAAAAGSVTVVGAAAWARRVVWRAALGQWSAIVGCGVVYAAASWSFIAATTLGWTSIPAVLAALSPAPTMLLAWLLLSETLSMRQLVGIAASLIGVALVTLGLPQ